MKTINFRLFALMAVIVGLTGCGGGSSGGSGDGGGTSTSGGEPVTFDIGASASPSSAGTVSGGGSYAESQTITLAATPNSGYVFINWTEGDTEVSTNVNYTFTASANRTLAANFSINTHSVDASAIPAEGGSVSGVGDYDHGSSVTLTAAPNSEYTFVNWTEGGTEVSTSSNYTLVIPPKINGCQK